MTLPLTIAVLAKAPVPGRVKTRLCPPCSPVEAAAVARAALEDTLTAVAAVPASRHVLVLDGEPPSWLGRRFEVVAQRGGGLDARLAAAFTDVGGPTLLVGMDTPQVTTVELTGAALHLVATSEAVLGPALDGGYWAIGLRRSHPEVLLGVPMSQEHTGAVQLRRLHESGRSVRLLGVHRDVDRWEDALAVAEAAPHTRFATVVATVAAGLSHPGAA